MKRRGPMNPILPLVVCLIVIACGGGCEVQPRSKLDARAMQNIAVSQDQLRLRVRALAEPMCARIEREADAVIAGTSDRNLQLATLTWEIDAVTAMRQSLYQPDPLIAAVDAMSLCNQLADYFESGPGKAAVGADAQRVAATCRQMHDDIVKALSSVTKTGDTPTARAFARRWAADHPIQHSIAERQSTVAHMTEFQTADGLSATESIADVTTTLDDMNRKLELYSSQLFRQARWEAQRMKLQLIDELRLDQAVPLADRAVKSAEQALPLAERAVKSAEHAVTALDQLTPAVDRSLKIAQDTPAIVASQRELAVASVHEEVTRALEFAQDQRLSVMRELSDRIVEQRKLVAGEAELIAGRQIDYAVRQVT